MKTPVFILIIFTLLSVKGATQVQASSQRLVTILDSMASGKDRGRYFSELYLQTTINANLYIQTLPASEQTMMQKLEQNFAVYFFRAVEANNNGTTVPAGWKNYFNGRQLSPLQLKLMGANAHINGDIWKVLIQSFSLEEIQQLQPAYKEYNRCLNGIFNELFKAGIESDKRLKNLHAITIGFDKVYAKIMLRKWRNRQYKLAIYSFANKKSFQRLKKRLDNKMQRIDKMIIRRLRRADIELSS